MPHSQSDYELARNVNSSSDSALRCISEASLWVPKHTCVSAWIEHAPFAFWLMDVLRPRRLVELGTHYGYSYFAFCQAAQRLGSNTAAYAVDTWRGDEHAGFYGDEIFQAVSAQNRARYSGFSTLLRASFEEAQAYFENGSVNLLHIDGRHFYEDVSADYALWRPKLAADAIVLLHDTNVRERGFGVWRFFEELAERHPSFNFHHGHGLGVVAAGAVVPEALQPLFSTEPKVAAQIRATYAALGSSLSARRALAAKTDALATMLQREEALSLDDAQPLALLSDGEPQVQEVLAAFLRVGERKRQLLSSAETRAQEAMALAETNAQDAEARRAELAATEAGIRRLGEERDEAHAVAEAKVAELAQLRSALDQVTELREERQDLRARMADLVLDLKRTQSLAAEKDATIGALQQEIAGLLAQHGRYEQLAQRLATIELSTSWKMMGPAQWVLNRAPRVVRTAVRRTAQLAWWTAIGQLATRLRQRDERLRLPGPAPVSPEPPTAPDPVIPEAARSPEIDYSLKLPLRHVAAPKPADGPVAAILHLFFPELAVEFRGYLENIPGGADLYVSTADDFGRSIVEKAFSGWEKGRVEVRVVPNRGRDIAPKLVAFRDVYDRYDYVLHLHSKRSGYTAALTTWRHFLLENLLGSPAVVSSIFSAFTQNPKLGMVASQHFEPVRNHINWGGNVGTAAQLAERMGFSLDPAGALDFPSGSMFWARSAALRPLIDLQLAAEDFAPEGGQKDTTLAHTIERLYFHACERAGFDWIKVSRPELFLHTPAIISVHDAQELDRFFARLTFRLLDPGEVRPRSVAPLGIDEVSPHLCDSVRAHALGCRRAVAPGTRLSVGIVTYNNDGAELRRGIGAARLALERAGLPAEGAILVLDNGRSSSEVVPEDSVLRRLPSMGNVGFGAGHNALMQAAFAEDADIYLAVNPDGALHPDALGALARVVQAHAGRVLVEGLQFPSEHPKPYDPLSLDTPWVSGACLAIPRQAYEELGGFDETFFMYCEDVDLSWRARAAGFALKICPPALFLHAVTNRETDRRTLGMIYSSGIVLARRWGAPQFEAWAQSELSALGQPAPTFTSPPVPQEWRRFADFEHNFSFAKARW